MSERTYTIRELCDEFGVSARTLRFYEAKELLSPARDGQHRLFSGRDRARLKLILRGKRFGFSLAEIGDLLDLYHLGDGGRTQLARTLEAARRHREDLAARREELDLAIADLDDQMTLVEQMLEERSPMPAAAAGER